MKTILCFILTLSTFVIFVFLPNSFAQNPRPVVRLIYFLPSDQQLQQDIDTKMDALIKDVQRVYADEMERHGFGRKTFQIETDPTGKAILYRVNGRFADVYYQRNWNTVGDEISKKFDLSKNVYVTSIETNSKSLCGIGTAHSSMGGSILIPSSGLCFGVGAVTHELGHVFGLDHDFRNNLYHMSYGADWEKNQFSQCAAKWLDAHQAFNSSQAAFDNSTTVRMLTPSPASTPDAIRLRFEVTDSNGLHQAQLLVDTISTDPSPGSKLIDCQSLSGKNSTVEFVTTLLTQSVYLAVMDAHGNFTRHEFLIELDMAGIHRPAGPKIEGPWLWTIVSTGRRGGAAAAASGIDYLSEVTNAEVTEIEIATNGATVGDPTGGNLWTLGKIAPTGNNNIGEMLNNIGLGGNRDNHVAYGCISLHTPRNQNTTMYVGSDDAVKVWLNGVLVHDNPVDRGASNYKEFFPVTLKKGKNILLVAVYENTVNWSGFFGFATDTEYTVLLPGTDINKVSGPLEDTAPPPPQSTPEDSTQQDSAEVPQEEDTPPKPETFTPSAITAGQITFSELMFATSGGLFSQPQWIELFNNGPVGSEPVNLKGSRLVIEARDSETRHRHSTIVFEDLVIKPKWTVLLVTRDNSRDSGHLPEHRVYSLSDHSNVSSLGLRDNAVLPASGFSLKLFAADGTLIDSAGNLDGEKRSKDTPAWELPTGWTEDRMRTSLIRRYEDGTALPGTEAMSWLRAADVQITTNTYYGHKADIGNPGYGRGGPLPVVLSAFRSERVNAGVIIEWTTESETDNAGFNILRSQTKDGSFVKVNPTLIPGAGTTAERNNYTWTDTTAKPNVAYYYQIEDVSLSGDRQRLATVRMKGYVSASDKLTTTWSELKVQD